MITLRTLHLATRQQVFDQIAEHLLKQGVRCIAEFEICDDDDCEVVEYRRYPMYRYEGLKSPAGCLMADDEYSPTMEHTPWLLLASDKLVPVEHCWLIADLELIHDTVKPDKWREELFAYAMKRNLSVRVLEGADE